MKCEPPAVPRAAGQPEAFRDHALAGKRRVAVHEQRHHHGAGSPAWRRVDPAWRAPCRAPPGRRSRGRQGLAVSERCTLLPSNSGPTTRRGDFTSPEPSISFGVAEPPLNSWKMARCGSAHHLRQHVEPAAMRHADDDLLHAERAAALDDLLKPGNEQLRRRQGRKLCGRWFSGRRIFRNLSDSTSLSRIGAALAGEAISLSGLDDVPGIQPFCAGLEMCMNSMPSVWQYRRRRIAVICRSVPNLEPEHLVEKSAIEVGVGEAERARIDLGMPLGRPRCSRSRSA